MEPVNLAFTKLDDTLHYQLAGWLNERHQTELAELRDKYVGKKVELLVKGPVERMGHNGKTGTVRGMCMQLGDEELARFSVTMDGDQKLVESLSEGDFFVVADTPTPQPGCVRTDDQSLVGRRVRITDGSRHLNTYLSEGYVKGIDIDFEMFEYDVQLTDGRRFNFFPSEVRFL